METETRQKIDEYYEERFGEEPEYGTPGLSPKILIAIISGIVVILAVIAILIFVNLGSDKVKLAKAVKQHAEDISSYRDSVMTSDEADALAEALTVGDATVTYRVDISGLKNIPVTIGLDGEVLRKYEDKEMSSQNKLSIMNNKLASAQVFILDDDIFVKVPELFDEVFHAKASTFATDFNNSYLSELSNTKLPSSYNLQTFGDENRTKISGLSYENIQDKYADELKEIGNAVTVKADKDRINYQIGDGSYVACKKYRVVIPKEQVNELLRSLAHNEEISIPGIIDYESRFMSDINISVLVDKDNQIRRISSDSEIEISDYSINLCLDYIGDKVATDHIRVDGEYDAQSITDSISADVLLSTNGDYSIDATVDGEYVMNLKYDGNVYYDEDARKLIMKIGDMEVTSEGNRLMHLRGECEYQAMAEGDIRVPDGEVMEIMDMGLNDLIGLVMDLQGKADYLQRIYDTLGGLF